MKRMLIRRYVAFGWMSALKRISGMLSVAEDCVGFKRNSNIDSHISEMGFNTWFTTISFKEASTILEFSQIVNLFGALI